MLLKIHFFKYTLIITHTTYIYLHRKNGYCMDNYRNGQLGSYRCNTGYKWQKWDIINVSGSTFKIKNVHMKKCLIPGGKESNCDDARALWILEQATNRKRRAANDNNDTETMKSESTISTEIKTGVLSKSVEKLHLLLDPKKEQERQFKLNESMEDFKNRFGSLDLASTYSNLFEILWYSQLPCFDIKNVTSDAQDQMSMIKQCYWKGKEISCSSIFKTLPSDRGMCCSFNMEKAEEIFKTSDYANLVKNMHKQDIRNRY